MIVVSLLCILYVYSDETTILLDTGKTCLAKRFCYNSFQREVSTIGIDIFQKQICLFDKEIQISIYDTAGIF